MENSIPPLLSLLGIIYTHTVGKIRFHYNETEYYFRFDNGGAAFLYKVYPMDDTTSSFHEILLADAMEIDKVEEFLETEILKRKNDSQSSRQPAS